LVDQELRVVIRFSAILFVVTPNAVLQNAVLQNAAVQNAVAPNVAPVVTLVAPNVARVVTREVQNVAPVVTLVARVAVILNAAVRLVASPFHDDQLWELLEGELHEVETQVPKLAPVVRCAARV